MTVPPEGLPLAAEFPDPTREQWQRLVEGVLRKSGLTQNVEGALAEEALATQVEDGLRVRPLYTAEDSATDPGYPGFPPFVRGSRPQGSAVAGWDVRQLHGVPDPQRAAEAVLADLENGVSSLWLTARRDRPAGRRAAAGAARGLPRPGFRRRAGRRTRVHGRRRAVVRRLRRAPGAGARPPPATSGPTRWVCWPAPGQDADTAAAAGRRRRAGRPLPPGLPRGAGADRGRPRLPRGRRLGRPGARLRAGHRRRLPARADRRRAERGRGRRAAGVPLRVDRRPVPDDRQAARRPRALGAGCARSAASAPRPRRSVSTR